MKKIVAIALSVLLVGSLVFAAGAVETQGAGGSLATFFSRPIGNVIWVLIAISLGWAFYDEYRTKKRERLAKEKKQ